MARMHADRPLPSAIISFAVVVSVLLVGIAPTANAAPPRRLSVTDATMIEGDAGTPSLTFMISYTGKSTAGITVGYATVDGTAVAGSDYTAVSGTATLPNGGCKCISVDVPITADLAQELTETFTLQLSNPVKATIRDGQGTGAIFDDDGPPTIAPMNASAAEASGSMTFTLTLTDVSVSDVTVDYTTASGTASSGDDFQPSSGSVTFVAGDTQESIVVPLVDDVLDEDDELFTVALSNPTNATLAAPEATGTIIDDDAEPSISVSDASVSEGDNGTTSLMFDVTLSAASGKSVTVDYATIDAGASSATDYATTSGTLTFEPGDTTEIVEVLVHGDAVFEIDEAFVLNLTAEFEATIADDSADGSITNDDAMPSLSIGDVTVAEGDAGSTIATFAVTKTGETELSAGVNWATGDGSASSTSDYVNASGSLTFGPLQTAKQISITITGDDLDEADEQFVVELSGATSATIDGGSAVGTITDDEETPSSLSLKAVRKSHRVSARGILEPASSASRISVTLAIWRDGRYRKVAAKTVGVTALADRDADTLDDARYIASFRKPSRGRYRFVAWYAGTETSSPARRTMRFRI